MKNQSDKNAALARCTAAAASRPNPARLYLQSVAASSRRAIQGRLRKIARLINPQFDWSDIDWSTLRYQDAVQIRALLTESGASLASTNAALSCLRRVARQAWREGLMNFETYEAIRSIEDVKGVRLPKGRALTPAELRALFDACASDLLRGKRDAALLAAMCGAGLRRHEAVQLQAGDYDRENRRFRVIGKGNKERFVYPVPGAIEAIEEWLQHAAPDGPLFPAHPRHGERSVRPMTAENIWYLCRMWAARAGVEPFTPHDLRRTYISELLDAGADIASVAELAGHSKIETTRRYDRRGEKAKQKAAEMWRLPYRRRS